MLRYPILIVLSLTVVTTLAGCGFAPVYGTHRDAAMKDRLSQVKIDSIPDESGIMLRNALIDSFYQHGYPDSPSYRLTVSKVEETISDLDITIESEATRRQVKVQTTFALKDTKTGESVLSSPLHSISSYNVLGSQFTNRVSLKDAREAALNDLARQIETQVALYLKDHP